MSRNSNEFEEALLTRYVSSLHCRVLLDGSGREARPVIRLQGAFTCAPGVGVGHARRQAPKSLHTLCAAVAGAANSIKTVQWGRASSSKACARTRRRTSPAPAGAHVVVRQHLPHGLRLPDDNEWAQAYAASAKVWVAHVASQGRAYFVRDVLARAKPDLFPAQ